MRPTPARWTEERVGTLTRLWNEGRAVAEIAHRMRLSRAAVESKLAKLRRAGRAVPRRRPKPPTRPRGAAMRRCLHCGRDFASEHVGNRICPACLADGPFTSALV
jgi:hypothetical protein